MYIKTKFLTFFIFSLIVFCLTIATVFAHEKLTDQSLVYISGIGPVQIGMSVNEASQAAGTPLVKDSSRVDRVSGCFFVKPKNEPKGINFMVTNNRISRVDVFQNRSITTIKGARIGDTEDRIKSLYPGRIKVTPHVYNRNGKSHYLTFVPQDQSDKNYRLVFETDGDRVTLFRAGKLPEVEWVEDCV